MPRRDQRTRTDHWPEWVNGHQGLRRTLDLLVHQMINVRIHVASRIPDSQLVEEAGRVERAAHSLMEMVWRVHRHPAAGESSCRERALWVVGGLNSADLTPEEKTLAEAALSPYALQFVLLTLEGHMAQLRQRHSHQDGRPRKHVENWAVGALVMTLSGAGVDLGRRNAGTINSLCQALFSAAGWPKDVEPSDRTLKALRAARGAVLQGLWKG